MKQNKKQVQAICIKLLLLFLCTTMLLCVPIFAGVKLSKKKVTIEVGKKYTLNVTGTKKKVKWTIGNKKLISLKTKGAKKRTAVITGKKVGTCYVTAKIGKKKLRCRITVKKKEKKKEELVPAPVDPTPEPQQIKIPDADITKMANVSIRMFQEFVKSENKGNVLVSPHSILEAVALFGNGASGTTRSEIEAANGGIDMETLSKYLIGTEGDCQTANSIWCNKPKISLKQSYIDKVKSLLKAEIQSVKFDKSAVNAINSWVAQKTNGKINGIIDRLDEEHMCVLINALYFKGEWVEPYSTTINRTFTDSSGCQKDVKMLEGLESEYITLNGGEGFIKRYTNGFAFVGMLPPESQSVEQFVSSLTGAEFVKAFKDVNYSYDVYTRLPEFTVEYKNDKLISILQSLGIRTAFTDNANFSLMTNNPLKVTDGIHKTYMKLDKNGTEAAAVTAFGMKNTAYFPVERPKRYIYLDKPFVYAIVNSKTGLPIFLGVMNKI